MREHNSGSVASAAGGENLTYFTCQTKVGERGPEKKTKGKKNIITYFTYQTNEGQRALDY